LANFLTKLAIQRLANRALARRQAFLFREFPALDVLLAIARLFDAIATRAHVARKPAVIARFVEKEPAAGFIRAIFS
jgi:hypothetical protein